MTVKELKEYLEMIGEDDQEVGLEITIDDVTYGGEAKTVSIKSDRLIIESF